MNCFIILCALFSICAAAVIPENSEATILNYQSTNDGLGNYQFSYETSNGIYREERGYLVNAGEDQYTVVKGSYRYIDENGKQVIYEYTADENGYRPVPNPANPVPARALKSRK